MASPAAAFYRFRLTALITQHLWNDGAPVGPGRTAMAGSIELPTMFIIGFMLFVESIGFFLQILSGLLVMTAIVITPAISSKRRVMAIVTDEANE